MHLIIAEDDPTTLKTLARAAEAMGHQVRAVSNGDALVAAFAEEPADTIVTDWEMPGLNGPEAVARVRALESGEKPFIILLTGVHEADGVTQALDSGCDDYLLKPLNLRRFRVAMGIAEARSIRPRPTDR